MNGYREFWNNLLFGSDQGFAGTYDITEYWLRVAVVVAVGLLIGIAGRRYARLPLAATIACVVVWVIAVGPFVLWAATCPGCGSASSYDSARSYEAMLINQWWGGLLAMAVAAVWCGVAFSKRLR